MITFESRWRDNWPAIYDWWIDHYREITLHDGQGDYAYRNRDREEPSKVYLMDLLDWRNRFRRYLRDEPNTLDFAFSAASPLGMPDCFEIYGPDELLMEFKLKF